MQGELYERLEEVAISRLVRFSQEIYNKYRDAGLAQSALREIIQRMAEVFLQSKFFKTAMDRHALYDEDYAQEMKDDLAESLYIKTMERINVMRGRYKNKK